MITVYSVLGANIAVARRTVSELESAQFISRLI